MYYVIGNTNRVRATRGDGLEYDCIAVAREVDEDMAIRNLEQSDLRAAVVLAT